MIQQGAGLFDELVVVLAVNPDKRSFLALEQRQSLLACMLQKAPANVRLVTVEQGFLVDFAREVGASFLLRGVRTV